MKSNINDLFLIAGLAGSALILLIIWVRVGEREKYKSPEFNDSAVMAAMGKDRISTLSDSQTKKSYKELQGKRYKSNIDFGSLSQKQKRKLIRNNPNLINKYNGK